MTTDDKKPKSEPKPTVMLVDDNAMILRMAEMMLRDFGYEVVPASDGDQALSLFTEDPDRFACVLCDVMMPRMNGVECRKRIRTIRRDMPVLLCSGYSDADLREHVQADPPIDFIRKPFDISHLEKLLEQVIRRSRKH